MLFWQYVFWISVFLVFYNYIGYGLLLLLVNRLKKKSLPRFDAEYFPTVSFIVAAYNEADCIEKKIINSLQQDYPPEKIEFIFITDGSTDETPAVVGRYPLVKLLHRPERLGKTAALNRAVEAARHDILIFSDANTFLNGEATRQITRHYALPRVGGVAGEKKVLSGTEGTDEVGAGEGLYWKYESFLKQLDSDFYSVVGAAGELFSLRRALYEPVNARVILDDFIISMKVAQKGYRVIYEPGAYAMELPSFSLQDEQKRKVRIAAGGFQAMGMLKPSLNFARRPRLAFLYVSHRVLRWTLSPLSLLLAFFSSGIVFAGTGHPLYGALFGLQLLFYAAALLAPRRETGSTAGKLMRLCYYFAFMNLSVIQGFFRFLRGGQSAAWEKARRSTAVTA